MAFYNSQDEEDQDPNLQQGQTTGPQAGIISGQGTTAMPGGGAPASSPDHPGNFVGIQQYINANKPQAAKLGDQTANVVNESANQARSGVQELNQAAEQQIHPVQGLSQDVSQKLSSTPEALSNDERNQIKQVKSAQYNGPMQAADISDAFAKASGLQQKAVQNLGNTSTEAGRMNLISQVNNKPRTQGMNVFDNALLQSGGGREKLSEVANANQDVKGVLDQASQGIQQKAQDAQSQTQAANADANKKIQDALAAWKSGFQPKVQDAQNNLVNMQNAVTGDLGDNQLKLNKSTMDLLGLNGGQSIYNLNLSDYLNPANIGDINANNVASAEDYARYGALADLSGEQNGILNPANASMAGSAPQYSANKSKLAQDIENAKSAYNQAYHTDKANYQDPNLPPTIPGAGHGAEHFYDKTPEEIETQILPGLEQTIKEQNLGPGTSMYDLVQQMKSKLANWKNSYGLNNQITQQDALAQAGMR